MGKDDKKEIELTVTIEDKKDDFYPFNSKEEQRDYERLKKHEEFWFSRAWIAVFICFLFIAFDCILLGYLMAAVSVPLFAVGLCYLCTLLSRYGWPYPY